MVVVTRFIFHRHSDLNGEYLLIVRFYCKPVALISKFIRYTTFHCYTHWRNLLEYQITFCTTMISFNERFALIKSNESQIVIIVHTEISLSGLPFFVSPLCASVYCRK